MSIDPKVDRRLCAISEKGQFAMMLDVLTPKPGNVHRYQDHPDTRFIHFAASITQLGHPLYSAAQWGYHQALSDQEPSRLGELLKTAVQASMAPHGKNTLLGTILLLIPLAAAAGFDASKARFTILPLHECLSRILQNASVEDAVELIRTLQIASPGGAIPNTPDWTQAHHAFDFQSPKTVDLIRREQYTLRDLQALAASYDTIAEEYTTNFTYTFKTLYPQVQKALNQHPHVEDAVLASYLWALGDRPDSFIKRKAGPQISEEIRARAQKLYTKIIKQPETRWLNQTKPFDEYLRSEDSKFNPGTTADLLTASIFLALLLGDIKTII